MPHDGSATRRHRAEIGRQRAVRHDADGLPVPDSDANLALRFKLASGLSDADADALVKFVRYDREETAAVDVVLRASNGSRREAT